MRLVIDDINHTVTVYEYDEYRGQTVEVESIHVRRQPVLSHDDTTITLTNHPRVGSRIKAVIDGEVYEAVAEDGYGGQDMLAQIGSPIALDDTPRTVELTASIDNVYKLTISGGTVEDVTAHDIEHPPLPAHVEEVIHLHIKGY